MDMSDRRIPSIFEIINAVDAEISVIDQKGEIVFVNNDWVEFGAENGLSACASWIGRNYIAVCEQAKDRNALAVVRGLRRLLSDDGPHRPFEHEYPCHTKTRKRWFLMVAKRLVIDAGGVFVVIIHYDITRRKLAEQRVERLSQRDPLTGLGNRRFFNEFLKLEWRRVARSQSALALLMIDIDHFKSINDTMGHLHGDKCLKMVASVLSKYSRRPGDLAARVGGEEFAMIMEGVDVQAVVETAEHIRRAVNNRTVDMTVVTVSIGVAVLTPDATLVGDDLVRRADTALYQAKMLGRNRVEIHSGIGMPN